MENNGHSTSEAQSGIADLPRIEAEMGHYARLLWDVQKVRVAVGNRKGAIIRDGLPEPWTHLHNAILEVLEQQERVIDRTMAKLVKQHIMADWVETCPGLGYGGFARIVGVTGSFLNFPNPAKVWKYMGQHVVNGKRPRRERGVQMVKTTEEAEGTAFSPQGQVVAHQIGDAIVKLGHGKYRGLYDKRKAATLARPRTGSSECPMGQTHKDRSGKVLACVKQNSDGSESSGHLHNDAMRIAVKELLKDMWVEWKRRATLEVKSNEGLLETS